MKSGRQRRVSAREAVACIFLCLFLFQGLFAAVALRLAASSHELHMELGFPVSEKYCSSISDGADGVPPDRAHDHPDCCILCKQAGRDASLLFVVALLSSAVLAEPRPKGSAISIVADEIDRRRTGWGSSWSSRAPPFFS